MRSAPFAAMLASFAACSAVSAGIELNGSFETALHESPGRYDISGLDGWTATGGSMLLERGVNGVSNIEAHSGDQFVSMGHSGAVGDTLTQTLRTVEGQAYEVSFVIRSIQGNAMQALYASAADQSSGVELGSVLAVDFGVGAGWTEHRFAFVAASESTTLKLLHSLGSTQANLAVDSIEVLVPAPGVLAAFGLGLIARRRR